MTLSFELLAVIVLVVLAFGDLIVGVVNDAVNFLNSAIGSKVASKKTIMIVAAVGLFIGATFSDGIIEVARKGIFHPSFFELKEVIIICTAVALADIVLLDLYSTFGLPTSTTVSIVFELLGAAFILALWKTGSFDGAWEAVNSASALKIIIGILLSVAVAFVAGLVAQFVTRLILTYDFWPRMKTWGVLWGGAVLTALLFFILLKGGKHAPFMTPEVKEWIKFNTLNILWMSYIAFTVFSFVFIRINKEAFVKFLVLLGTCCLAIAFAGNDLANFIAVSIAGVHAFLGHALEAKLTTPLWALFLAGGTMVVALIYSRKAGTVVNTSVHLASEAKHVKNHFNDNPFAAKFISAVLFIYSLCMMLIPKSLKKWMASRFDRSKQQAHGADFDLIRAGVNLMVAGVVISLATSMKLPLSTTYVTFMVAMGAALGDGAWTRDCGACRVTGVATVVGGWFVTAVLAFIMAGFTVSVLHFAHTLGLALMVLVVGVIVYKLAHVHDKRNGKAA